MQNKKKNLCGITAGEELTLVQKEAMRIEEDDRRHHRSRLSLGSAS
jgi:hypothetical protein